MVKIPQKPHPSPAAANRASVSEERRRTQRVLLRVPVIIHLPGKSPVHGNTHTVSAGGATIVLKDTINEGTKLTIENPATKAQIEGKVVRPPQLATDGVLVPIEFTTPSPTFWNIFFPPSAVN